MLLHERVLRIKRNHDGIAVNLHVINETNLAWLGNTLPDPLRTPSRYDKAAWSIVPKTDWREVSASLTR